MANAFARTLRKSMTDAEMRLWYRLRPLRRDGGMAFRRQSPIGRFIVDFECRRARLVIELDGADHAWIVDEDRARDAWLTANGYVVMRFLNTEVLTQTDHVVAEIVETARNRLLEARVFPHEGELAAGSAD